MSTRSYTDDQLAAAVASSRSWRGVLRALGLKATSAGSARSVRRHADRLEFSYSHFTGQRRWSDSQLATAIEASRSWQEVATSLDLSAAGMTVTALRAHALRLELSTEHLSRKLPEPDLPPVADRFDRACLRDAGSLFAAAWFTLRGAKVSWPLEPCRYDLVADVDGSLHRVQVKTTTTAGRQRTSPCRTVGDAVVRRSMHRGKSTRTSFSTASSRPISFRTRS